MKKNVLPIILVAVLSLAGCNKQTSTAVSASTSPSASASESTSVAPVAPSTTLSVTGPAKVYTGSPSKFNAVSADGQTYGLTWTTADAAIATVNSKGTVTGVAAGKTTVSVALTDFPEIKASIDVEIVATLPTLADAITYLNTVKNYTVKVDKGETTEYETFQYNADRAVLKTANGTDKRYAIGKDGIAFSYRVDDQGVFYPGAKMKDLSGYVTKDTFLGNSTDPYYVNIPAFGNITTDVIPAADDAEGAVYSNFDAPDTYSGDRYTMNKNIVAVMADIDRFDYLFSRPTITAFSATGTDALDFTFTVEAKKRGEDAITYTLTVGNVGTTVIADDGVKEYVSKYAGGESYIPQQLNGIAAEAKLATSYEITDGTYYDTVFTDTYMYSYQMDDCFNEDYDPTSYKYDGYGYVKKADGIYAFTETTTYDKTTTTITRATPVLGDKVEGTTADSTMADTLGYISTWKVWDEMDLMTDTTKYMSSDNGWATGEPVACQDAVDKASKWGYNVFAPSLAAETDTAIGYRFHIADYSMYYPVNYIGYSQFTMAVGYLDSDPGRTTSGYTYGIMNIKNMTKAKNAKIAAWMATV
jgi:hypothetical protein